MSMPLTMDIVETRMQEIYNRIVEILPQASQGERMLSLAALSSVIGMFAADSPDPQLILDLAMIQISGVISGRLRYDSEGELG